MNNPISATGHSEQLHGFREATRSLTSVLAPLEKRTLVWLAHQMPGWVNSDHLTLLAFVAMVFAGLSYWLASLSSVGLLLVVACLAVNWFGDSLDGTLARVRDHQRPRYGFYVDHVVDLVGTTALVAGMGVSGTMHPLIAAAVLIAYILAAAESFLATHATGTFRISFAGVGPTELRILLAVAACRIAADPTSRLLDVGGAIGVAGLVSAFVIAAVRTTRALRLAEPLPRRDARRAA